MLVRIHRSTGGDGGGSGNPQGNPPPNPIFQQPPTGAPGGPPIPPTIPLTIDEYNSLREDRRKLSEFQSAKQAELDKKEQEKLQALAAKGDVEKAFNEWKTTWQQKLDEANGKYVALETAMGNERKSALIRQCLNGKTFQGRTPEEKAAIADMAFRLIEPDLETRKDASGVFVVVDKASGRPAADVIRERLESPQFSVFFIPNAGGGSGIDGTRPASPPANQDQVQLSQTLAEWGLNPPRSNSGLTFK